MKIIILVLSYKDNGIYSSFYQAQKDTWDSIHVEDVKTYYYFGNSNKNEISNNEIFVDSPENKLCIDKFISTLGIIKDLEFDFLVRTNSSSYLDKQKIKEFLKSKPRNNYYGGFIGYDSGIKFASGSLFFLSRDVYNIILNNIHFLDKTLIDDVSIGKLLSSHNIFPDSTGIKRFNYPYDRILDFNFLDYFHYRLYSKPQSRYEDIDMMKKIFEKKNELYYRK